MKNIDWPLIGLLVSDYGYKINEHPKFENFRKSSFYKKVNIHFLQIFHENGYVFNPVNFFGFAYEHDDQLISDCALANNTFI